MFGQEQIQDFQVEGVQKIMCKQFNSAKREISYGRGPGLAYKGSSGSSRVLLMLSHAIRA